MRRAFQFLLALSVLWCGLHLSEAVAAPAETFDAAHLLAGESGHDDEQSSSGAVHACHHHCPVAPEFRAGAIGDAVAWTPPMHHLAPAAPLHSRAASPLLEPPTA